MVEEAVKAGLLEYETQTVQDDADHASTLEKADVAGSAIVSSQAAIERCRRPWFICQPHVRPLPEEALAKGALTLSKKEKARQAEETANTRAAGLTPGGTHTAVPLTIGSHDQVAIPQEAMVSG